MRRFPQFVPVAQRGKLTEVLEAVGAGLGALHLSDGLAAREDVVAVGGGARCGLALIE